MHSQRCKIADILYVGIMHFTLTTTHIARKLHHKLFGFNDGNSPIEGERKLHTVKMLGINLELLDVGFETIL